MVRPEQATESCSVRRVKKLECSSCWGLCRTCVVIGSRAELEDECGCIGAALGAEGYQVCLKVVVVVMTRRRAAWRDVRARLERTLE